MKDTTQLDGLMRNSRPKGRGRPLESPKKDADLLSVLIPDALANSLPKLTPRMLESIIASADGGDPREQAALFSTMQEKEPLIAAHLQTRRLAVLACDWSIRSKKDEKKAEEIQTMLRKAGIRKAIHYLLDCLGTGYAGVSVDWAPGGAEVRGFVPIMPDAWTFDEAGFPAINSVTGGEIPLASYHPAQILYLQAEGKVGLPCRKGLMRTLLWMYLFKNAGFRDWSVFLERFGMPFMLGKIPSGDFSNIAKRNELLESLLKVRSGGAGVGTTETEMQMLNGAASGSQEAYERFQRYCDEIFTLTILGQLGTSAESSGFSNGGAQAQVRQDLLDADALMIQDIMNMRLIPYICQFKYGMPDAGDIEFVIECEPPEDLNTRADRDSKLAAATGCKLSRDYAMKTYGVELEEREEQPPQLQQPFPQRPGRPAPFSDEDEPKGAADRIVRAALGRMVEEEAFEAFRVPIDRAIRKAFGDLDPDDPDLVDKFKERAPKFLESLPGLMDEFDASAFTDALQGAMLASFLNGTLPADFWRKKPQG